MNNQQFLLALVLLSRSLLAKDDIETTLEREDKENIETEKIDDGVDLTTVTMNIKKETNQMKENLNQTTETKPEDCKSHVLNG